MNLTSERQTYTIVEDLIQRQRVPELYATWLRQWHYEVEIIWRKYPGFAPRDVSATLRGKLASFRQGYDNKSPSAIKIMLCRYRQYRQSPDLRQPRTVTEESTLQRVIRDGMVRLMAPDLLWIEQEFVRHHPSLIPVVGVPDEV